MNKRYKWLQFDEKENKNFAKFAGISKWKTTHSIPWGSEQIVFKQIMYVMGKSEKSDQ